MITQSISPTDSGEEALLLSFFSCLHSFVFSVRQAKSVVTHQLKGTDHGKLFVRHVVSQAGVGAIRRSEPWRSKGVSRNAQA